MALIRARPSPQPPVLGRNFDNTLTSRIRTPPVFYHCADGPAPSHDNDHANFRSIQILPTTDEVLAAGKPMYVPKRNLQEPSPIPTGVDRLLDLVFRHLRFESVERIRDICYSAAQTAFLKPTSLSQPPNNAHGNVHLGPVLAHPAASQPEPRQESPIGNRYFLYQNVQVEELVAHESKSVLARLSYDCPRFMRGRKIHHTGRFEQGMLVAVLCLDWAKNELDIQYLEVHMSESTHSMNKRGGQGRKAAVQVSFLANTRYETVQQFAKLAQKLCPEVEMWLVEFPKTLHAGFYNCLSRLQKIHGFAFSGLIAPSMSPQMIHIQICQRRLHGQPALLQCKPPKYAEGADFQYHLEPIAKPGSPLQQTSYTLEELRRDSVISAIQSCTTLDQGQADALRHSLLSSFCFSQGPPGTGKTYTGIALTHVLLASRPAASKKPILVVCLTNHALDSFLGGLKAAGVKNLLRVGSGSKEEWTKSINLREKGGKARYSPREIYQLALVRKEASDTLSDIDSWCRGQSNHELTGETSWFALNTVLFNYHRDVYDQLNVATSSPMALSMLFDFWAKGGDLRNVDDLRAQVVCRLSKSRPTGKAKITEDVEQIMNEMTRQARQQDTFLDTRSIWNIPGEDRKSLIQSWARQIDSNTLADDLARWYIDHQFGRDKVRSVQNARDTRVMQQADVIGITTTACAGRWDLLKALNLEIVVCEEAGEVLEPHVICSLLPTLQHAIFIGDPEQLRPEVSEHVLSMECTSDYRLDESLFEKMTLPKDPALSRLPMTQLNIQRRMHPSISDIARITYPFLQDHPSTLEHASTIGLQERLFWWDHRVPELEDTSVTKSHINQHEVDMVAGLVRHLLNGSAYSQGDIAVLTPYSGQLACLCEALKSTCKIWLSDRDREMLLDEDLLDDENVPRSKNEVSMSDMLRIATVDNFQGEEAKIVILTTVRSGGRPGFLSIPNRINVACSRARNGFYIIGNSETLSQVPMWNSIIRLMGTRRGFELLTNCPKHPFHRHGVCHPNDLETIPTCLIPCGEVLTCGHACPEKCHAIELHNDGIIPCSQPCEKLLRCGHRCTKRCGVKCGTCQIAMTETLLDCGHTGFFFCSGEISKCNVALGVTTLPCGHSVEVLCGDSITDRNCNETCLFLLDCGHQCSAICGQCHKNGHAKCSLACGKLLDCEHRCKEECGHGGECPSCEKAVQVSCQHGKRTKLCKQLAELCLKPLARTGDDASTPCCLPSTMLPSSEICTALLPCGHSCPSLASERCIPVSICPACCNDELSEMHIFIDECGHLVDVKSLDQLNLQNIYKVDQAGNILSLGGGPVTGISLPKCLCGTACPSVRRYEQIPKFSRLSSVLDAFTRQVYTQLEKYSFAAETLEQGLQDTFELLTKEIRRGPMSATFNQRLLMSRKDRSKDFLDKIHSYRVDIVEPFEKHIAKLQGSSSFILPHRFVASLHLQTVQTRGLIVSLLDQIRVATHLIGVEDRSSIMRHSGVQLLRAAAAEAIACYDSTARLIADGGNLTTSPALLVETRLQEALCWLLAEQALRACQATSTMHTAPATSIPVLQASLDVAVDMANHYPSTCKPFLDTALDLKRVLEAVLTGKPPDALPKINASGARKLEKQFGKYAQIGCQCATLCEKAGHAYFSSVFAGGCPDCGNRVELSDEVFREMGKHLFEEDFLAAMKKL